MARCAFQIICTLIIHLWLSPHISSNTTANPNSPQCIPSIMVPRNTVWKVRVMDTLKINCTVTSDPPCFSKIDVSWCKINEQNICSALNHSNYIATKWNNLNKRTRLLFLYFMNISMLDAGLYRCSIKSPTSSVSHSINVTVTDYTPDCDSDYKGGSQVNNTSNSSNPNVKAEKDRLQTYMYIYIGIGALFLIVVVVSVTVCWCRGQKKSIKEKTPEKQSTATPMADVPPPVCNPRQSSGRKTQTLPAQLSPPPACIYDTPRARVTSLRERSSDGRHPVSRGLPRQSHDHGAVEEEEEDNPLIYASLNHGAQPQRPVRVAHVQIEASEYAAIKIT